MPPRRHFYVYMLQSRSRHALYTGITNNIYSRKDGHEAGDNSTFAGRYRTCRVVYLEVFEDVRNAIAREKQIKGWTRARKEALIKSTNPHWLDLSAEWKDRYKSNGKTKGPSAANPAASG